MKANIGGTVYEGRTLTEIVQSVYGPGAAVMPSPDPNNPVVGQIVRRAYQNAYDVLGTVRSVWDEDGPE